MADLKAQKKFSFVSKIIDANLTLKYIFLQNKNMYLQFLFLSNVFYFLIDFFFDWLHQKKKKIDLTSLRLRFLVETLRHKSAELVLLKRRESRRERGDGVLVA